MDISPLADKQQRNRNRNNSRQRSDDPARLEEFATTAYADAASNNEVLSIERIRQLIEQLNQMAGPVDMEFELKLGTSRRVSKDTVVEIRDTEKGKLLLGLKMRDLVVIEKQINEDRVEALNELVCGSFFSLTA